MKRPIRIFEIPALLDKRNLSGSTAIVIDVLRATSSMITALHNGCRDITPVVTVDEAFALKQETPERNTLLCGERQGKLIPGFDLGNSPLEYTRERIAGRTLIWTTTNGTAALHAATGADTVLVAAMLNIQATAQAIAGFDGPVNIICAGTFGEPTLEDTVCAGWIAASLCDNGSAFGPDDHTKELMQLADNYSGNPIACFLNSKHGRYLTEIGFDQDLAYCAQLNSIDLQVEFQDTIHILCRK